ncbi:DoxX family protein [Pseudactinotalea suaedae]|uniref:DoxX family protein n=1 Tax=Pseudactinotalea suaedae TaxID=1524924 RepID=UPI0012E25025|nr:DoxX family protein [Pseudactinotalea suaedae]
MNTALWIVTALLSLGYGVGGLAMLIMSPTRFRNISSGQHYVDDLPRNATKVIGVMKLLAVAGMLLPPLLGVATWLVPLAALGLVLLMTGAATVRMVRREWVSFFGDLVYLSLAAFVAWGRFVAVPFG